MVKNGDAKETGYSMWQKIGRIIIALLCLAGIGGFVYLDNIEEVNNAEIELSFYLGDEVIRAWECEDTCYLFLPSYADVDDLRLTSYASGFEVVNTGEKVEKDDSLYAFSCNEKYNCRSLLNGENFTFCVMKSANLPTIFMDTDSGTIEYIWSDKEIEENGKMRLLSEDGSLLYTGGLSSVKARGNYSFSNYGKKPFSIKLKDEVSLLGLGEGKKYALLSNASDPTLIRNDIARKLEAALEAEYDNIGCFVDLYANGEYLGVYYLCENIEIGDDRIAVTDLEEQMDSIYRKSNYESFEEYDNNYTHAKYMDGLPADITGGYLVEREFVDRYRLEYWENPSGFVTEGGEHFFVKSPMYCSVEQVEYLRNYMNEVEEAILSPEGLCMATGKSYKDYIDVDSFVKKYLVEEITKNYDAGISSMFFYKDSDTVDARIKAAPIWDADMSLGCYLEWMEEIAAEPEGLTKLALHPHSSPWYEALYKKEEYYQKILKYYRSNAVPYLDELMESGLDAYKEGLAASATMNDIRWQIDLDNNMYYEDRDTEFEQLEEYITDRKIFLDSVWVK